eukprot:CAMPEP_0116133810 /NCGR_PEP_ID=MMETSP0329-20121206/10308_1 /TAXON_ID=697910 /ORGANISM="Pseudo-nitzschia arenysensis, Strain B593" /LENGTH=218 /DNA_ID=CAMNT_0003628473 /DNA_START=107 /DNA_END=763 /DNA_ORIENTATION=+
MSTTSKNKRGLSDVTNAAPPAQMNEPEKKAKQTVCQDDQDEKSWTAKDKLFWEFECCLSEASDLNAPEFKKALFDHLWNSNGEKAVNAIIRPFQEKVKKDYDKNDRMAGTWELDNGGTLTVLESVVEAAFSNSTVDVEDFHIKMDSHYASKTLEYAGRAYRWGDFEDEYEAELKLTYDPETDTINGTIEATPNRFHYDGPRLVHDGEINFTAKRKQQP